MKPKLKRRKGGKPAIAEVKRFVSLVHERLKAAGAVPEIGRAFYGFVLQTPGGEYKVHAQDVIEGFESTASFIVFGRFEDPKAARAAGFDCNPYSGKFNFHLGDPTEFDATEAFDTWTRWAARLIPEKIPESPAQ